MKNRAKCKLCNCTIESFHESDIVFCKCNEIFVEGGPDKLKCGANKWENFIRVDDEGNEIIVSVKDKEKNEKPKKDDLLKILDEMIKNIENLPANAMLTPINNYDFCSALILISSIMRSEDC